MGRYSPGKVPIGEECPEPLTVTEDSAPKGEPWESNSQTILNCDPCGLYSELPGVSSEGPGVKGTVLPVF